MNILMILTDQMHKYAMGTERDYVKTPNLDSLAKAGFSFKNAYSNNPVCGPYRGCLFTGLYTSDNHVYHNGDPLPDVKCLADAFNEEGYETSFVGKWHLGGNGNKPIPEDLRGGFKHFIGYQCFNGFYDDVCFYDEENKDHKYYCHRTDVTTDIAIERLKKLASTEKPFLQVVFYQAPHYPEQPSPEYEKIYKDEVFPIPPNYQEIDPYIPTYSPRSPRPFENCPDYQRYGGNIQEYLRLYYGMVSQIDNGVGRILECLDQLDLREDTFIIFSSDHGDLQGCHGLKNKKKPYEESCGVPLVMFIPGMDGGQTIEEPVSCIDFYPTCLDLCDINSNLSLPGSSLLPLLKSKNKKTDHIFAESIVENWVMVRDIKYKFVVKIKNKEPWLLFDMEKDPYEMNNLVDCEEYTDIKNDLMKKIIEWNDKRKTPPL